MAEWRIDAHPEFNAIAADAPAWVLRALDAWVYPALRTNPTDERDEGPVSYRDGWWVYKLDLPGRLAWVIYEVLDDERLVMTRKLVWVSLDEA